MTTYLYTHNDLDALGCAIVTRLLYGESIKISYNSPFAIDESLIQALETENFEDSDQMLVADISPSKETCVKINEAYKKGLRVQLIDHHKTKMWINKYKWAICDDTSACGAKLLWIYNSPAHETIKNDAEYTQLIEAINAWDLWKTESPHRARGEELNSLLKFIGKTEFLESFLKNPQADSATPYSHIIGYLQRNRDKYVKRIIKDQLRKTNYHMDDLGNTYKIIFAGDYISEVGNAALNDEDSEDLKYVVIVNPNYGACSLRSRAGEVDVSAVAKRLGGGGHAGAAGFHLNSKERIARMVVKLLSTMDS